jgi:hypothetical protein
MQSSIPPPRGISPPLNLAGQQLVPPPRLIFDGLQVFHHGVSHVVVGNVQAQVSHHVAHNLDDAAKQAGAGGKCPVIVT